MRSSNTSSTLFNLSDNAISALKKADPVQQIISLRGKVIVDSDLRNLCNQISNLPETIKKLAMGNQQINSELAVVKLVYSKLEKQVTDLEKNEAKLEEYSRSNNVEFSNVEFHNGIPDNQLESKGIEIFHELVVAIDHNDIEGCHCLPVSRYNRGDNKRLIVKFVNRKHSETLMYKKRSLSPRDFSNINISSKIFVSVSLCPYYRSCRWQGMLTQGPAPDPKCLKSLMSEFIQSAKNGTTEEKGFAQTAYGMSKVGVTLMTQIQQREFDEADQTILINSCCPGYVATDMSSYKGPLQVDEGADTPCYLALLGQNAILPRGCFHKLREVIPYPPQV